MTASSTSENHRAALETNGDLNQVNETLSQRTVELGAICRQLNHEIVRRKAAEEALAKSEQQHLPPKSTNAERSQINRKETNEQ